MITTAMLLVMTLHASDFGVVGDGLHDERPGIQATLDAARAAEADHVVVQLPAGILPVSRAGALYRDLLVDGVELRGAGRDATTLVMIPTGPSVRMIEATGRWVISDLTIDGNRATMSVDTHRHGVFVYASTSGALRRVTLRHFNGDGVYLYSGARDTVLEDVISTDNDRNGLTLGSTVTGTRIEASRFIGNAAQQIDSEPAGFDIVSDVRISGTVIDGLGMSNDYALTISGTSAATPGHDWIVEDNVINGGILVINAHDIRIAWNRGINPTTKPSFEWNRAASGNLLGNRNEMTQDTQPSLAAVYVVGTAGAGPRDVEITGNRLRVARGMGIRAEGAISISALGNTLEGPGPPGVCGIYLRATSAVRDFELAVAHGNRITGFAKGVGIYGNGDARLLLAEITRNQIAGAAQALMLDDGTHAAQLVVQHDNVTSP